MWMNLTQLNIFIIVSFVMLVIVLLIVISVVGNKLDEQECRIKELEKANESNKMIESEE